MRDVIKKPQAGHPGGRELYEVSLEQVQKVLAETGYWDGYLSGNRVQGKDILGSWELGRRVYFTREDVPVAINMRVESMRSHLPAVLGDRVVFWDYVDYPYHDRDGRKQQYGGDDAE